MKKALYICMLLLIMGFYSQAQQQIMFTQYMFNQLAINPAYAGIHQGISTSFLTRHQWVGFEGAPKTQTFSIHSPVKFRPIAFGAVLIKDQIGISSQFGALFSSAYRIKFDNDSKLSFGIQASYNQYRVDYTESAVVNPLLASQNFSDNSFNAGAGLLWHSERFYLGFSVPQLMNNEIQNGIPVAVNPNTNVQDPDTKLIRHYFLSGGYVFRLDENLQLKPNVLLKWVQGAPMQIDLNTNLLIKETVWLGVSYRVMESIDALCQVQITKQLQIGYSYDFSTNTEMSRINNGSHEIMVSYVFNLRGGHITSPRFF